MKKSHFLTLIFTGLLLFYAFKDAIIFVAFESNRDFIAAEWCENKDQPQMHCDGNCVFMKAIKESHKKDAEFPAINLKGKFLSFVSNFEDSQSFTIQTEQNIQFVAYYLRTYEHTLMQPYKPPRS